MSGLFNELANAGMEAAKVVCDERGEEYKDSWRDCRWETLLAILMKALPETHPRSGVKWEAIIRAIALAAMVDIKRARYGGGWKDDTGLDIVNYQAALNEQMKRLKETEG